MHQKRLYGTATIGTKGQIVIPAKAREELGLETGQELFVVGTGETKVLVLLPSESIEGFIQHLNLQIEQFDSLKKSAKKSTEAKSQNNK